MWRFALWTNALAYASRSRWGINIMLQPNPQIELEARQTVLDQVVAGASFTAYEITLEVRRRLGAGVEVPHPVVNGVVQTMFSGRADARLRPRARCLGQGRDSPISLRA